MYLLSVFLSIGTTIATFALSGKVEKVILLFIAKGFERTLEANLTNLIGNLSVPASFFEFNYFNIFSNSSEVIKILREKLLSEQDFELTSDLILRIPG